MLLCLPTEKCDMFTLEACAQMAESLERVLTGFVDFVMVSWVIHLVYAYPTPYSSRVRCHPTFIVFSI